MEKIPSDTTGNRSRDPPTSSAVPLPLRYPRPKKLILRKLIQEGTLNECRIFEFNVLREFKFQYEELYQSANQLLVLSKTEKIVAK